MARANTSVDPNGERTKRSSGRESADKAQISVVSADTSQCRDERQKGEFDCLMHMASDPRAVVLPVAAGLRRPSALFVMLIVMTQERPSADATQGAHAQSQPHASLLCARVVTQEANCAHVGLPAGLGPDLVLAPTLCGALHEPRLIRHHKPDSVNASVCAHVPHAHTHGSVSGSRPRRAANEGVHTRACPH